MSTKTLMEEMQAQAGLTEALGTDHPITLKTKAMAVGSAVSISESRVKKIKALLGTLTKSNKEVPGGAAALETASDLVMKAAQVLTQAELLLDEVKGGHVGAMHRLANRMLRQLEPIR